MEMKANFRMAMHRNFAVPTVDWMARIGLSDSVQCQGNPPIFGWR
jgi:hypothetical protein